jgi:hypothetical protein
VKALPFALFVKFSRLESLAIENFASLEALPAELREFSVSRVSIHIILPYNHSSDFFFREAGRHGVLTDDGIELLKIFNKSNLSTGNWPYSLNGVLRKNKFTSYSMNSENCIRICRGS